MFDQAILDYMNQHPEAGREEIRKYVIPDVSETTMWRVLKRLVDDKVYIDGLIGISDPSTKSIFIGLN